MTKLSAIIIDTFEDKGLINIALQMVKRIEFVDKIFLFSDTPFTEGCEFKKIDPIKSQNEYGHVIFEKLHDLPLCDHFFIFQWDGFPLFPNKWDNDYLKYDYIGSPDGDWVGNGGFSLRSKKLIQTLKKLNITIDLGNPQLQLEDQIICTYNRELLMLNGIKFAPKEVAKKFSYDDGPPTKDIFGFHGPKNFPYYFEEDELVSLSDRLIDRINHPNTMYKYISMMQSLNKKRLIDATFNNFRKKPNMLKLFNALHDNYPDDKILGIFKSFDDTQ